MTLGRKIYVQIDEDELEMLDDAGILFVQVDALTSSLAQKMSIERLYHDSDLCVSNDELTRYASEQSSRVGQEWEAGLLRLARATQERLGWQPRMRRIRVTDEMAEFYDAKPLDPSVELRMALRKAMVSGRMTGEAMYHMTQKSGQASAAVTKLAQVLHKAGRFDPASDSFSLRGMTMEDIYKEGILPRPKERDALFADLILGMDLTGRKKPK